MQIDIDTLIAELEEAGMEYAENVRAANLLEETKKTVLARLASRSNANSIAARESEALASDDYEQFIKKMNEARHIADVSKVKLECIRAKIDLIRTESANARAAR